MARLLGLEDGDPEKVLDGLGAWDLATRGRRSGSTPRVGRALEHGRHAAASSETDPSTPDEIDTIDVELPAFLTDMVPYHEPPTGLQAKYSIEYDMAAIVLDGRAGIHQYTDEAVRRPEAQSLMKRGECRPAWTDRSKAGSWSR